MDEHTPPLGATDRAPAAPHAIRDGTRLAHDLCQEFGLPTPHACTSQKGHPRCFNPTRLVRWLQQLADLCTNNLLVVASFKVSALIARIDMLTVDRELTEHRQLVAYAVATLAHNYSLRHDRQRLPWTRHHASHASATGDTERVAGTAERTTALAEGLRVSWTLA